MAGGWSNNSRVNLGVVGGAVIIIGLFVLLVPDVLSLFSYLSQGFSGGPQEGVELIESLAVSWWIPLALSAPFVFVGFVFVLQWIGAEAVLEM